MAVAKRRAPCGVARAEAAPMTRRSLGLLVLSALVFIVMHAVLASRLGDDDDDAVIISYTWVEVLPYLAAVGVVLRDRALDPAARRRAVTGILIVAAVLRAITVTVNPVSSDINRYVWDGRVQAAGITPYRYIPADPALAFLRDDEIYPEINRADYAPTIYPPLAQVVFFLVTRVSETLTAMKLAMTLFDAAAIWALLRLLRRRGMPPTRILLYAWHPLPIWQFSGDGHVDAIAVACISLSLLAAEAGRPVLAGIAMGGAALTKFFPVVIGPALYRRWDWKLPLAGFLTLVALYLPYVGVGGKLFGFLSGYSDEEGYRDGSGVYLWILLKHLAPGLPQRAFAAYAPAAAVLVVGLALIILFRVRRAPVDFGGAFLLAATFSVLSSPHYMWYLSWLVPFLCFYASGAVLWLTLAATYMTAMGWPSTLEGGSFLFLPPLAIAACEVIARRLRRDKAPPAAAMIGRAGA